ncbi:MULTISPECIES: nitroreductase family protein [Synechococcaceae]|uniref:nitroreductase family protein n=2 Tax=Synechococcales TaxID=1890424 RepID=UPI0008FF4537|nr:MULTISPECIES: nitroreductase family protein [Synechococcaceae]MCT4365633.1 nitroreductase family protein [Candidatus Regnicoccus frigidus MAG-AL1]APD47378.1 reductase DrgA [Synechococcus sp. SynAce01]MCT0202701.1 nitroreductase family protein [Synechococcus sp. CS-603]MCT0246057.1 nitroreductase family protein [Synechococcus sp. CS-601]MCT4368619.1 nitroreductase family protein [Candidatus Regnicoccus frigidus MAG-AL2]
MDVIDAIDARRAVKHFDPDHRLSAAEERRLLEITIQAPSSFNIQHWRFVILRDPALRARIRRDYGNDQAQITDASLLVLFTADLKAWSKQPERYWANAPQPVADLLVGWMGPFHEGREWLQRDEAQRSIGLAMQTLMLAATGLGYQSCPMIGFEIEKLAELIHLPEDHVMGPMVAIGKGTQDPLPKPGQLALETLVVDNGF